MWGVITTLGMLHSGWSGGSGSWGATSSPTDAQQRQARLLDELSQATPRLTEIGKPVAVVIPTSHDPASAKLNGDLMQRVVAAGYPTFGSIPAAARTLRRLNTWRARREARV